MPLINIWQTTAWASKGHPCLQKGNGTADGLLPSRTGSPCPRTRVFSSLPLQCCGGTRRPCLGFGGRPLMASEADYAFRAITIHGKQAFWCLRCLRRPVPELQPKCLCGSGQPAAVLQACTLFWVTPAADPHVAGSQERGFPWTRLGLRLGLRIWWWFATCSPDSK